MAFKLPVQGNWTQPNTSEKFGSVYYSKNLNFDKRGFVALSPRLIKAIDESANPNFGIPVTISKTGDGIFIIPTTSNAAFDTAISATAFTFTENTGTANPTLTIDSHGTYYNDLFFASTDTAILSRPVPGSASSTWTSRVTGLTSGKRHYLEVFSSKNTLCVTNGNEVKQYNSSYANTTDLTIPSDFEAVGLAHNDSEMIVITRPATIDSNKNAFVFLWDGTGTSANSAFDTGSDSIISCIPYKSSFVLMTRQGELLFFNGGGFDKIAQFPFFFTEAILSTPTSDIAYGDNMTTDGDRLFINTSFVFNGFGKKNQRVVAENLSGVWCYDPDVGLYHRYTPSASQASIFSVTDANVNTSTDVLTVSSGTVVASGNPVRYTNNDSTAIGGLKLNHDYFVIKVSDTTFKLATTKENALNNIAIDITSTGSGGTNHFYMYDLVDYGSSYLTGAGAIALLGTTTNVYGEVLVGSDIYDTSLSNNDQLSMGVPFLENRGYLVLPRLYAEEISHKTPELFVKHPPLDTGDAIVVKARTRDVIGLPMSNATTASATDATWSSPNELYATFDCSEAKTYLDNDGHLEMEIISGAGAGTMVQVESIDTDDNLTYSFVLKEDVLGAVSTRKCNFILDNWEEIGKVDSTSEHNDRGYSKFIYENADMWTQYKIELRGNKTMIESIYIDSTPHNTVRR